MSKKIIFYIPSIEGGGVEKNLFLLIRHLSKDIKKVHVITANKIINKSKKIKFICPRTGYWHDKSRLLKNIICIYLLIKNFWSSKAVIVSFQSNITSILLAKIFNFKVLIRLNTSVKKYIDNILKRIIFKFFYLLSDVIIVNSKSFQNELSKINLKSHLIYNLNIYEKKRKKLKIIRICCRFPNLYIS